MTMVPPLIKLHSLRTKVLADEKAVHAHARMHSRRSTLTKYLSCSSMTERTNCCSAGVPVSFVGPLAADGQAGGCVCVLSACVGAFKQLCMHFICACITGCRFGTNELENKQVGLATNIPK